MTLSLTREEAEMLREILDSYLSDLRMEIADTENIRFREELKRRESFLQGILEHLTAS